MKKGYIFLLVFWLFIFTGCGESIYKTAEDKSVSVAKQDTLDYDFINGNYGAVVNHFDAKDISGKELNNNEAYMYLSSILGTGGFNVLNGIDAFTNNNGSQDIYSVAGKMIGVTKLTSQEIDTKVTIFQKASTICNNRGAIIDGQLSITDVNVSTLCTFTGMIGTTVNLSSLVSQLNKDIPDIELSEQGFMDALKNIEISGNIDNLLTNDYLDNMTNMLNCSFISNSSVENILGDTSTMMNKYKEQLYDNATHKVSKDKLTKFILDMQSGLKHGQASEKD